MALKNTNELMKLLSSTKNVTELKQYTDFLSGSELPITFPEYLNTQMASHHLTASELIREVHLQRNYGYQILDGKRNPSRDKVIALCLALHLNITDTQRALNISQNGQLYSKSRRDSILIFAIEKNLSVMDANELLFEMNEPILT